MKMETKNRRLFRIAVVLFCGLAASVFLMPLSGKRLLQDQRELMYFTGGLFWFCFMAGYGIVIYLIIKNRKSLREHFKDTHTRAGIFSFFTCKKAAFIDVIFLCSFIWSSVSLMIGRDYGYPAAAALSILILSANLHCLFNSRLYRRMKEPCRDQQTDINRKDNR